MLNRETACKINVNSYFLLENIFHSGNLFP